MKKIGIFITCLAIQGAAFSCCCGREAGDPPEKPWRRQDFHLAERALDKIFRGEQLANYEILLLRDYWERMLVWIDYNDRQDWSTTLRHDN
jgi:hypothetical protein